MPLWHFKSDTLKGFYASEVYASAISKPFAVKMAGRAFDKWAADYHKEMGYWPLVDDYFNEEKLAESQLAAIRDQFIEEAHLKMKFMGSASVLTVS